VEKCWRVAVHVHRTPAVWIPWKTTAALGSIDGVKGDLSDRSGKQASVPDPSRWRARPGRPAQPARRDREIDPPTHQRTGRAPGTDKVAGLALFVSSDKNFLRFRGRFPARGAGRSPTASDRASPRPMPDGTERKRETGASLSAAGGVSPGCSPAPRQASRGRQHRSVSRLRPVD
jgi:hypothetical protein